MNLLDEKQQIIDKLKDTNEEWIIKSIKKLLDIPNDYEEIVGYTVVGDPITRYQLVKDIEESNKDFENGDYIENKDLLSEVEKWRKK